MSKELDVLFEKLNNKMDEWHQIETNKSLFDFINDDIEISKKDFIEWLKGRDK